MKPNTLVGMLVALLCVFLATDAPYARAQANAAYVDTTADLQRFLQEILDATKKGDRQKVESLLKSTEVPDCDAWLHRMYRSDSADSWMSLCDPNVLLKKEKAMAEQFAGFAKEGGDFSIRRVNDDPQGGKGGLEFGMVHSGKEPLEVYFASWKALKQPKDSKNEPIGYFYYLAGGFRWDSLITIVTHINITHAKILPAKLIRKVDPVYPAEAQAQHISGTVRVYFVIGGDGVVYNAHALSGEGLSEDPSLRKAAEDAVIQWRYEPATMDGKPIQTNAATVDIIFPPRP